MEVSQASKWNAVVVTHSDSQKSQTVSFETPRYLLQNPSSGTLLGYVEGSNQLEIIEFDGEFFKPHLVEFQEAKNGSGQLLTVKDAPSRPRFDHPIALQPCYVCHSGKEKSEKNGLKEMIQRIIQKLSQGRSLEFVEKFIFRPNWEGYPHWAASLFKSDYRRPFYDEASKYGERFINTRMNDPLFQSLFHEQIENAKKGEYFAADNFVSQLAAGMQKAQIDYTNGVITSNIKRVAATIAHSPGYSKYKNLFSNGDYKYQVTMGEFEKPDFKPSFSNDAWISQLPINEQEFARKRAGEIQSEINAKFEKFHERKEELIRKRYGEFNIPAEMKSHRVDMVTPEQVMLHYVAESLGLAELIPHFSTAFKGTYGEVPISLNGGKGEEPFHQYVIKEVDRRFCDAASPADKFKQCVKNFCSIFGGK